MTASKTESDSKKAPQSLLRHARAKCTQVILGQGRAQRHKYVHTRCAEFEWASSSIVHGGKAHDLPPPGLTESAGVHATHVAHADNTNRYIPHSGCSKMNQWCGKDQTKVSLQVSMQDFLAPSRSLLHLNESALQLGIDREENCRNLRSRHLVPRP